MKIIKILSLIENEDRENWFRVGSVLKTELGEELGLEYWREWSRTSLKFDEADLLTQWKSIDKGNHSFFWLQKNLLPDSEVDFHKYLYAKGILKLPDDVKIVENTIAIPIYSKTGDITSVQYINERGTKSFKKGVKLGNSCYTFSRNSRKLIIAEGFATAFTIYKAVDDIDVMVSFSKARIKTLLKSYASSYTEIYVAMDSDASDDFEFNKSLLSLCTNTIVLPFNKNISDFNDLEKLKGILCVSKTIKDQLKPSSICLTPIEFKIEDGDTFITLKGSKEKLFRGSIEIDSFIDEGNEKVVNFIYNRVGKSPKKVTVHQKETAQKNKLLEVIDRFDLDDTGLLYLNQSNQKYILSLLREFFKDKYLTPNKKVINVHNYGINKDGGYAKGNLIYYRDSFPLKVDTSCDKVRQILNASIVDTGSFEDINSCWAYLKEAYQRLYSNIPIMQKFMLCLGVGIPSYSFFCDNEDVGGVVSLVSDKSGIGKTHICNRVLSMYAKPQGIFIAGTESATKIGLSELKSKLNSLPLFWDEVTAVDRITLEEFIFNSTKKAVRVRANEELKFQEQHNFCITTSNVSINTILMGDERGREAISKRVFEIYCTDSIKVNKEHREEFQNFNKISGVVGQKVLEYVLANYEEEKLLYKKGREEIEERFSLDSTHRFITNILNCVFMGRRISEKLGLFYFDSKDLQEFITNQLSLTNDYQIDEIDNCLEKIKNLIAMNQDKIVKIGKSKTALNAPIRQVAILDEDKFYYITCTFLKGFFTRNGENHLLITKKLEQVEKAKVVNKRVPQIHLGSIVMRCLRIEKALIS
ncbi:MAG: primase C [Caudoviricetes sp.]|nr:MAG: primase C [Caudoviricetes sp.]